MSKITNLLMLPLICGLFVFFAACSNSNSGIASSIPANSTVVLQVKVGQLMKKVDYSTIKQTEIFKDALEEMKKETPSMVPFMEDPASTGIDMEGDLAIAVNPEEETGGQVFVAVWPVADKAKVIDALKKSAEGKGDTPKMEEREGYTLFSVTKKEHVAIGDKVMAVVLKDDDASIKEILSPSGEGILENPSFAKHHSEGKDVLFWVNTTKVAKAGFKQFPMAGVGLGMAQINPTDLEENYMAFYYDFQKGELDAGGHFDFNEELKGKLGGLFTDKVTSDYAQLLPSENLLMAGTFALNPEGIVSYLGNTSLSSFVDPQLETANLSLGKLKDILVGDMAAAVYGGTSPSFIIAIGIKDEKLMSTYLNGRNMPQEGDIWAVSAEGIDYKIQLIKGQLVIASSLEALEAAKKGGKNATVAALQEGWMGAHVDYEALVANKKNLDRAFDGRFSTMSLEDMEAFKSMNFCFKGADMDGKMYMKNASENAIKTILMLADKSYVEDKNVTDEFDSFDEAFEEEAQEL